MLMPGMGRIEVSTVYISIHIHFYSFFRGPTTWSFCRILTLCIIHWRFDTWNYTEIHSMLQRWTQVTTPKFYNKLYTIRTLRDLLQRTIGSSDLSYRIWIKCCVYWVVRGNRKRWLYFVISFLSFFY